MKNINIETLKKLVDLHYELIIPLNISDYELWANYEDIFQRTEHKEMQFEDLERLVKKDILYDYVFNFRNIEFNIDLAMGNYEEDSKEFENIQIMIKEICKAFDLNAKTIFGIDL